MIKVRSIAQPGAYDTFTSEKLYHREFNAFEKKQATVF